MQPGGTSRKRCPKCRKIRHWWIRANEFPLGVGRILPARIEPGKSKVCHVCVLRHHGVAVGPKGWQDRIPSDVWAKLSHWLPSDVLCFLAPQRFAPPRYPEPLRNYGTLMTFQEFKECVKDGTFIDYDGSCYPSNGTHMDSSEAFPPSCIDEIPKHTTHVVWFNR